MVKEMLQHCSSGKLTEAHVILSHLWSLGYATEDIISIIFRVSKNLTLPEYLKLEFIKVSTCNMVVQVLLCNTL